MAQLIKHSNCLVHHYCKRPWLQGYCCKTAYQCNVALKDCTVAAGGGAVEAALSIYLEGFANTLGSREQLAIAEFADALLVIPKTLAVNAAKDATELVAKLRAYHYTAQVCTVQQMNQTVACSSRLCAKATQCNISSELASSAAWHALMMFWYPCLVSKLVEGSLFSSADVLYTLAYVELLPCPLEDAVADSSREEAFGAVWP